MIIASRPYQTPEARQNFVDTFGPGALTRGRWIEEAGPDETFEEWRLRMVKAAEASK